MNKEDFEKFLLIKEKFDELAIQTAKTVAKIRNNTFYDQNNTVEYCNCYEPNSIEVTFDTPSYNSYTVSFPIDFLFDYDLLEKTELENKRKREEEKINRMLEKKKFEEEQRKKTISCS